MSAARLAAARGVRRPGWATEGRGVAPRCRYLRRSGEQCTGEAVDPSGDLLICSKHLARAVRMFEDKLRAELEAVSRPPGEGPTMTDTPDRSGGYPAGDAPAEDWVDDGSQLLDWPDADPPAPPEVGGAGVPFEPTGDKRPGTWPTSPLDVLAPAPAPAAEEDPKPLADKVELLGYVQDRRDVPAALAELLRSDQEAEATPPAAMASPDAPAEPWPPVLPMFTGYVTVVPVGGDPEEENVGAAVTVTGSARFVERVIAAAADAFVTDAER